jgi:hypothetical protein
LEGENLAVNQKFEPIAVVNGRLTQVLNYDDKQIAIHLDSETAQKEDFSLVLTLDPYCIVRMNIR